MNLNQIFKVSNTKRKLKKFNFSINNIILKLMPMNHYFNLIFKKKIKIQKKLQKFHSKILKT